ncbi:hypothetical protein DO97_09220 [Neosynechococcus sphagnicola sy1]|uniref:Glycosyltransferase 2-like domain-containing protein n=1 Tax=Neosynechococcus sphagnicola sy1 TaxID=1497020 RepID=A0A098TNG0_9CYAN|nr:glycosyltransferase [Neosynechococcus sphagnicola]KGF72378.1 hypothetical protein DO97_09220 [Neosynechococcus sphagnicola sy1]
MVFLIPDIVKAQQPITLSVVVPACNNPLFTEQCLNALVDTMALLEHYDLWVEPEYLLIDDHSQDVAIQRLFTDFQQAYPGTRYWDLQHKHHYTGVLALGLDEARGDRILFLSNDMILTPTFLVSTLVVSLLDPQHGIVRGKSNHCDCFPQYELLPVQDLTTYWDICEFAEQVLEQFGWASAEDDILTGDCFILSRAVIDAIGSVDRQYFSYFGDIDYGLRAQRAGFKLVCALGAWLWHWGAGHMMHEASTSGTEMLELRQRRSQEIQSAYTKFRQKWQPSMPEDYISINNSLLFEYLRQLRNG